MEHNKQMPAVALGTWSWGTGAVGGDQVFGNHLSEQDLKPVFDAAMEQGLNLWDTAVVYGMGASEDILGAFAKTCPPGADHSLHQVYPSNRRRER